MDNRMLFQRYWARVSRESIMYDWMRQPESVGDDNEMVDGDGLFSNQQLFHPMWVNPGNSDIIKFYA